jgi:assimilatory nitrate reductase catalytic subunit
MHWGAQFMSSGGANNLMPSAFDPVSKQPELKHAAIRVEKLNLPWQLVVMRVAGDAATDWLTRVQPLLREFTYAAAGMFGRDLPSIILRARHETAPALELIARLDALLEFDHESSLTYADSRRGISKRVMIEQGKVTGVRLIGETAARDWLKEVMAQGSAAETVRPWVLAPLTEPPVGSRSRGRIVCNCFDVAEQDIRSEITRGADLASLQATFKCGTECGSCMPELKRLVDLATPQAA